MAWFCVKCGTEMLVIFLFPILLSAIFVYFRSFLTLIFNSVLSVVFIQFFCTCCWLLHLCYVFSTKSNQTVNQTTRSLNNPGHLGPTNFAANQASVKFS